MAKFVRAAQLIRQFKQSAAPTVAQGLTLDDTWIDTDDHASYVCTSISPVIFTAVGGGGGTPGGSDTQVQFNDGSSFGGDAGLTYNKTTDVLTATGGFVGNLTGNASGLSATLAVASGGTGATTLTANNVILGNGTSAVAFVAPGTSGNVLKSNGTTWTSAEAGGGGLSQPQIMAINSVGV